MKSMPWWWSWGSCWLAVVACGGGDAGGASERGPARADATHEASGASVAQESFLDENPQAVSAVGSFRYDDAAMVLQLEVERSDVGCDIAAGEALTFSVLAVEKDTLRTQMGEGDAPVVEWMRVGRGEGIFGSWRAQEGDTIFLLTLDKDGAAYLSVTGLDTGRCGDDGGSQVGYTTEDGCYIDRLPQATIAADGDFADWEGVRAVGDSEGAVPPERAADVLALYVAADQDVLGVRVALAAAPETSAVALNYVVGWQTERSIGSTRVRSEPGGNLVLTDNNGGQLAASKQEFELTLPWIAVGGRAQLLRLQVRVEGDTPGAGPLDEGPCFGEANAAASER